MTPDQTPPPFQHTRAYLTPDDVAANIVQWNFFTAAEGLRGAASLQFYGAESPQHDAGLERVTFCVVTLKNGTRVTGVNYGAIDPTRHNSEMGREEARKDAVSKVWELMGYELRTQLIKEPPRPQVPAFDKTQPCIKDTLTTDTACRRCKNPHHICDRYPSSESAIAGGRKNVDVRNWRGE